MPLQSSYPVWTLSVLQWRHNERDGVWDHQPHGCLLNGLFSRKSKKTSKLCVTGLCAGNSPVTGEFPAQRASIAENVSFWWRHQAGCIMPLQIPNPVSTLCVLCCVKYRAISCTAIYRVTVYVCAYGTVNTLQWCHLSAMVSHITGKSTDCSTVCSRKHQSFLVRGIYHWLHTKVLWCCERLHAMTSTWTYAAYTLCEMLNERISKTPWTTHY